MEPSTHDDHDDVRRLFTTLLQAWTDGDAEAYGRCFTDDADYVSFDGALAHGRRAIVRAHDALFRASSPAQRWSGRSRTSGSSRRTSRWSTPPEQC